MDIPTLISTVENMRVGVTEQRAALKAIFENIPDLKTVYPRVPPALQPANLPALVLFTGPAEVGSETADDMQMIRRWSVNVYVGQMNTNAPFELEELVEPWLDIIPVVLAAYPVVRLDDGRGFGLSPVKSSQALTLTMNSQRYAGCSVQFITSTRLLLPRL